MRKFILGCILILFGAINATGWLISRLILTQSSPSITTFFLSTDYGKADFVIIIIFYLISISGFILAILNLKEHK